MDENRNNAPLDPRPDRDQELFDAIGKGKKKKKLRRWITALVIVAVLAAGLTAAVRYGRRRVQEQMSSFNEDRSQVVAYTVDTGSVNTTVSGSGLLSDVDTEKLSLPKGVKVDRVLVAVGDRVETGDLLASVEPSSVMGALAETQAAIQELDGKLAQAARETVPANVTVGVNGRVKAVYAKSGDDVAACMAEHGALALVSLDGFMCLTLESDALAPQQEVTVVRADGTELKGTVESVIRGTATVLVTDNGPAPDEEVTVRSAEGTELGAGTLAVHNPMRITGYAGTIAYVYAAENGQVWAGNSLFTLKDLSYTANYESLLKDRRKLEEDLVELLAYDRAGGVEAPFAGTVSSIEWKDTSVTAPQTTAASDAWTGTSAYGDMSYAAYGAQTAQTAGTDAGTAAADGTTALLTLSPDREMKVTIDVDELNILTLSEGQEAQISVNTIADEVFAGAVTKVNHTASDSDGMASYSAEITLPKDPRMLPGMSARAVVRIQGVESAVLIPESALHQTRDASFVYTSYNYDTQEFGGAVAVVPGISNGTMIEILEGLSQGDTVYYTQVWDPWGWSSDGNASGGDAWVSAYASGGDGFVSGGDGFASDGNAE